MKSTAIQCPNCGHEFELTDVMTKDIQAGLQADFDKKLREEREKAATRATREAGEKVALELTDLRETLAEKDRKLADVQQAQLDLMKEKRALQEAKNEMELTLAKKLEEQRSAIEEGALKKFSEEHRQKDMEKDRRLQDMTKALEEAKRRAEQGSMERQGEVLEDDLENILKTHFRLDEITPVPKGVRGADVIQKVQNNRHQHCGTILWEAKTAKTWSDKWVDKLKEDQRDMGAEIAVIISEVLPKEIDHFDLYNGIWVTHFRSAIGLATALREQVVNIQFLKQASVGKDEKMETLFTYLAGPEFRQKIEAIVEAFSSMQIQIDKERVAMEKQWSERRKQLDRIMKSTVGMYGDMKGIIGSSMADIDQLSLDNGSPDERLLEDTD